MNGWTFLDLIPLKEWEGSAMSGLHLRHELSPSLSNFFVFFFCLFLFFFCAKNKNKTKQANKQTTRAGHN